MKKIMNLMSQFFIPAILLVLSMASPLNCENQNPRALPEKYRKWLEQEVVYIISQNEKEVFRSLITDEQREDFVRNFWKRHDPSPDTLFNEYREEHYRRIEYANDNFFEGIAGWRTDRGRTYIMFGPPDFLESNPGGGRGFLFDPSGPTGEFPSEVWIYRGIPGLKTRLSRIEFTFINYYNSGKYQLVTNPSLANALRNTSIDARNVGYEDPRVQIPGETEKDLPMNSLEQLQLLAEITKSRGEVIEELERSARVRRLKGIVESRESLTMISFVAKNSYVLGTNGYTNMPISIEVAAKELEFVEKDDRYVGRVNFFIEVKNASGNIYQRSDRLEMNLKRETYERRLTDYYQYKHRVRLMPGEYFLHLVAWDENSDHVGYLDQKIEVSDFSKKEFNLSDVILARNVNVVEKKEERIVLDTREIPAIRALSNTDLKIPEKINIQEVREDSFAFGNLEINPNTPAEYSQNDELVFFYQIYFPTFSPDLRMAKLLIIHQIEKDGVIIATVDKPQEIHLPESQKEAFLNSGGQHDLHNLLNGSYTLVVRVKDLVLDKTIERKIDFKVKSLL